MGLAGSVSRLEDQESADGLAAQLYRRKTASLPTPDSPSTASHSPERKTFSTSSQACSHVELAPTRLSSGIRGGAFRVADCSLVLWSSMTCATTPDDRSPPPTRRQYIRAVRPEGNSTTIAPRCAELAELQHRVEDALSATKAAMAEGIVAGGGAALMHAASALDDLDVTGDYAIGVEIVRRSLTEPTYLIATNAGYPGGEVVAKVAAMGDDDGFDALEGRYGNMLEMGIIDPLRVCRSALQNGASVAGLLLTTNTLIAEEQTPWGGSRALMTEFGQLDEGLHQPSPDSSTPQSLGLGPSVG